MSYYQSKLRTIGFGKETVRGTPVAPTMWFPWQDFAFAPKMETKDDTGSVGVLVDSTDSYVTKLWAEGTVGGKVYPNGIGFLLLMALGKVTTDLGGDNPVHTFDVENINSHPSYTTAVHDPVEDKAYPLTIAESLQISAERGGDLNTTVNIRSKKGQTPGAAYTTGYINEKGFKATDTKVYLADDLVGLDAATNICLQRFDLTVTKTLENMECLSSIEPLDFNVNGMTIELTIEMYRQNNTYRDMAFNDIAKAIRIQAIDESVDLDGENPTLTIDLAKAKAVDWTDAVAIGDTIKQTVKFKGHHSIADNKSITAVLLNTQTSY